jgi:hypothetical protein
MPDTTIALSFSRTISRGFSNAEEHHQPPNSLVRVLERRHLEGWKQMHAQTKLNCVLYQALIAPHVPANES